MGKLEKSQKILLAIGIVAVVFAIALFICFRLPVCQFSSDAMKDRGHFDEKIYYDESYVIETANLMTDADVQSNIYYTSIDFAFVTCYFFAMVFLIVPTLKKKVKWIGVCIPLIAAIFDMLENVSIMLVLHKNFALAPCMGAFGFALRRDRGFVQACQGNQGYLRIAQYDQCRLSDYPSGFGA